MERNICISKSMLSSNNHFGKKHPWIIGVKDIIAIMSQTTTIARKVIKRYDRDWQGQCG